MKRRAVAFTFMLLVAMGAAPASPQSVPLRYKWTKGDVLTYRASVVSTYTTYGSRTSDWVASGWSDVAAQTFSVSVAYVAPDGAATLRITVAGVRLDVFGNVRTTFDSAAARAEAGDPLDEMIAAAFGGAVGDSVTVVIAPTGQVRTLDGADGILERVKGRLPQNPVAEDLLRTARFLWSDHALRALFERSFGQFLEREVKPGETWTAPLALRSPGEPGVDRTCTFMLAAVRWPTDARVMVAVGPPQIQNGGPGSGSPSDPCLGCGGTGEIRLDIGAGRLRSSRMRLTMPFVVTESVADRTTSTKPGLRVTETTVELVEK